jgi:hypothetical protein
MPLAVAACIVSQCAWAADVWNRGQKEARNSNGVAGLVLNSLWTSFLAHLKTIYTKWKENLFHNLAYIQINSGYLIDKNAQIEHEVGMSACLSAYFYLQKYPTFLSYFRYRGIMQNVIQAMQYGSMLSKRKLL